MKILSLILLFTLSQACNNNVPKEKGDSSVKYNIIIHGNGIYEITEKDVEFGLLKNSAYEAEYYNNSKIVKLERFNKNGELTDEFSVPAVIAFEYDSDSRVKWIKYFDKHLTKSRNKAFGYWSVEYIYDELNRVTMEIYRDNNSRFLQVPTDSTGNIIDTDFLPPVITYEYLGDQIKIKAFDQNFNLLKEIMGTKPCVPFIDCGEND